MALHYTAELARIVPGLKLGDRDLDEAGLIGLAGGHSGLLLMRTKVGLRVLEALPALRAITFLSTGVASWIDLEAARRHGVVVRNVAGYGDRSVAEHAMALIFACLRGIALNDRRMRAGEWPDAAATELHGKRLAVIGLGGTGQTLAALGAAVGCEVVGWSRARRPGVTMLPLDECLASADIVSLHLALTPETRGIIDCRRLALLRPGAILVNTARGALIDEAALLRRLSAGDIVAGLDVFTDEPLASDHPLRHLDTVTLSPHLAWNTDVAAQRLLRSGLLALSEEMARQAAAPG